MTARFAPPDLDGFQFIEYLGSGGFADVFKYEQLGRMVAVKVLHGSLGLDNQRAFEAEAHTMAKLSSHPHVVNIHYAGLSPSGRAYLVMEYCPPPNLGASVRSQKRPYDVAKVLATGVQIAGAVESGHRLNILHRDVKPANILITEFGHPALTDFGIASSVLHDDRPASEGVSAPWAPPEQLIGEGRLDRTADVYSLAATLWTLLAGRAPFELNDGPNDFGSMAKRVRSTPVPRVARPDVPESLERVLASAMAKDPASRPDSAEAFAHALQYVQAELHLPVTTMDVVQVLRTGVLTSAPARDSGTRVVGFVSIDPDADIPRRSADRSEQRPTSGARRGGSVDVGSAGGASDFGRMSATDVARQDTVMRAGLGSNPGSNSSVEAKRRRAHLAPWVIGAAAGGAALLAVTVAMHGDSGAPTSSSSTHSVVPADPVGAQVPEVVDLTVTRAGDGVDIAWKPSEDTVYEDLLRVYPQSDQNAPPAFTSAQTPGSAHAKADSESVCADVVRRERASGSTSGIARRCVD